jgi:hypothetical protein
MVRTAGFSAGLKAAAALLAFAASLFYARALGPHGYGLFGYVVAWTSLISIPVSLGFPQYLVREGTRAPESLQDLRRYADIRMTRAGSACWDSCNPNGSLSADGALIDPENLRAWQQTLGYVPQTVYLADDTIASNIARRPQIADLVAMA